MELNVVKLDTRSNSFSLEFEKYKVSFFSILENSYQNYYGDDYQMNRITESHSTLYMACLENIVIGASYIKNNLRRGATAIYPPEYRRRGIAHKLVKASIVDFPCQYTILNAENFNMLSLLEKVGFKKVKSEVDAKNILGSEFKYLHSFQIHNGLLIFKRTSIKRNFEREKLTLLHTF